MRTISNNSTYLRKRPLDKGGGEDYFFPIPTTLWYCSEKNIINNLWLITHMLATKKFAQLQECALPFICVPNLGGEAV